MTTINLTKKNKRYKQWKTGKEEMRALIKFYKMLSSNAITVAV